MRVSVEMYDFNLRSAEFFLFIFKKLLPLLYRARDDENHQKIMISFFGTPGIHKERNHKLPVKVTK